MTVPLAATTLGHLAEHTGAIAVALLAAVAVVGAGRASGQRLRAAAMLGALVLTPILLIADIWHSPQLHPLRHHPLYGVAALVGGLLIVGALALLIWRRPEALPLLAIAALPFRLPVSAGGQTSNLLIPLYAVVAAGTLVEIVRALRRDEVGDEPPIGRLEWLLMGFVVLYAVQATYTGDFTNALKQVVFFYVPFALLFVLLRRVRWQRRLIVACLGVLVALALIFAAIGFYEYSRHEVLLNPSVVAANQIEPYFRVNSLFFDPNIYGRFLALVMLVSAVAMLWSSRRRQVLAAAGVLLVLWGGLMTSVSQSSIGALLLGLAVIAALRWEVRRTIEISAILLVAGAVFLAIAGSAVHFNLGSSKSANNSTNGRYSLVKGGLNLFADRPLQGFGSGSFEKQYRRHQHSSSNNAVSASHTIPITVAAEQGVVGLAVYVALVIACFARLFSRGIRGSPERIALAAAFAGLVLHTMLYADFLEDPVTWTLLAIGTALAVSPRGRVRRPSAARDEPATAVTASV